MKIGKWVLGILAAVIVLTLAAVATLTLLVDPNQFRDEIEVAVREATDHPFEIRGDLEVSWFPWLAVRMGPARLGSPPGVSSVPLAQWKSMHVGARLIPLLRGELVVDRIRLQGLQMHFVRTADGRTNWDRLIAANGRTRSGQRPLSQIAGIELRDSLLELTDERSGLHLSLLDWRLDAGEWKSGEWVSVRTDFLLTRSPAQERPVGAYVRLSTQAKLAAQADRLELRDTQLSAEMGGGSFAAGVSSELRMPQLVANLSQAAVDIPRFSMRIADADLGGGVTIAADGEELRAHGPLEVKVSSVRKLLVDLGVDMPLPRDTSVLRTLALTTDWAFTGGVLEMRPIAMQLDGTRLTGEVVRSDASDASWRFELHGDRIDLGRYLTTEEREGERFELPVQKLRALRVHGNLRFDRAVLADAQMKNVRLRLVMEDGRVRSASATP